MREKGAFMLIDALFGLSVAAMCVWLLCYCQSEGNVRENRAYERMQTSLELLKEANRLESQYLYGFGQKGGDGCDFGKIRAGGRTIVLEGKEGVHAD